MSSFSTCRPFSRPLLLSDAAINIAPDLAAKKDIVQNAIDCAHALGITEPRVAVLAAVETVHPNMPATTDAAALAKMAHRAQIGGGLIDGPLAFDNAIFKEASDFGSPASCVDVPVIPAEEERRRRMRLSASKRWERRREVMHDLFRTTSAVRIPTKTTGDSEIKSS